MTVTLKFYFLSQWICWLGSLDANRMFRWSNYWAGVLWNFNFVNNFFSLSLCICAGIEKAIFDIKEQKLLISNKYYFINIYIYFFFGKIDTLKTGLVTRSKMQYVCFKIWKTLTLKSQRRFKFHIHFWIEAS